MADKRHRLLQPADGVHVAHAFEATMTDEVIVTAADVGKIVKVTPPPEGEGGWPPVVEWYILRAVDDSVPETPVAWWQKLLTDADDVGGMTSWVTWDVLGAGDLNGIAVELDDLNKVARVANERGYYALADILEEEGTLIPIWKRLDNVELSLPIYWVVDPEGFPGSVNDIQVSEEERHRIAYDPSGTSHYWILERIEDDGMGNLTGVWRALDTPEVDLSTKADKVLPRADYVGTTHTVSAGDLNTFNTSSNAALQTWTLPSDAGADIAPVQSIPVWQLGVGRVRFVAGAGATVYPAGTVETAQQYALAHLTKVGANTWLVSGDIVVS